MVAQKLIRNTSDFRSRKKDDVLETAKVTRKKCYKRQNTHTIVNVICIYICTYCIKKKKNTIRNELRPRREIGTIFLAQEFRWHFSFDVELNFPRILQKKK